MPGTHQLVRETARDVLTRPDQIMLEIGANGELVAALLVVLTLADAVSGGSIRGILLSLAAAMVINVFAMVWLQLAYRHRRYDWLPLATAAFDVTATTMLLLVLAAEHLPAALNSLGLWCGYGLAIMLTGSAATLASPCWPADWPCCSTGCW